MKYLIQNKYWDIVEEYNLDKLLYLLVDRPDLINRYNDFIWENVIKEDHRDYDLPAYIRDDRTFWCKNDKLHRENNKPAIINDNGCKEYWINSGFIKV